MADIFILILILILILTPHPHPGLLLWTHCHWLQGLHDLQRLPVESLSLSLSLSLILMVVSM